MEKIQPIFRTPNYVVTRYRDGRIIKGVTYDFGPQKRGLHVNSLGEDVGKVSEVLFSELKAVFFVKSLERRMGPLSFKELLEERSEPAGPIKMKITFLMVRHEWKQHMDTLLKEMGFFVVPLEKDSNNLRIFIISSAVKQIENWK